MSWFWSGSLLQLKTTRLGVTLEPPNAVPRTASVCIEYSPQHPTQHPTQHSTQHPSQHPPQHPPQHSAQDNKVGCHPGAPKCCSPDGFGTYPIRGPNLFFKYFYFPFGPGLFSRFLASYKNLSTQSWGRWWS